MTRLMPRIILRPMRKHGRVLVIILLLFVGRLVINYRKQTKILEFSEDDWVLQNSFESTAQEVDPSAFIVKSDRGPDLQHLPKLNNVLWPKREFADSPRLVDIYNQLPFEPQMTRQQYACFRKLLDIFARIMIKCGHNDRWFLHSGTLLGSIRHHDIIPWDDDMDIMVDVALRTDLRNELKHLADSEGMILYEGRSRDKLALQTIKDTIDDTPGSRHIDGFEWSWPSLDLCYYSMTEHIVHELAPSYGREYNFLLSDVFPLIYRPLGLSWYPAPYKPIAYLHENYPNQLKCTSTTYSHAKEMRKKNKSWPCKRLFQRYAFVQRCQLGAISTSNTSLIRASEKLIFFPMNKYMKVIHDIHLAVAPETTDFALPCIDSQ